MKKNSPTHKGHGVHLYREYMKVKTAKVWEENKQISIEVYICHVGSGLTQLIIQNPIKGPRFGLDCVCSFC